MFSLPFSNYRPRGGVFIVIAGALTGLTASPSLAATPPSAPPAAVTIPAAPGRFQVVVADNGIAIPPENLTKVFSHGFTSRRHGHGFGLHSGANAAREMGGSLQAASAGPGLGAAFTFELPLVPDQTPP